MNAPTNIKTERTRLKRSYERGLYDRAEIDAILDTIHFCHVGYLRDGAPFVTPTLQWREGDFVYWHGSSASTTMRGGRGTPVCVTVSSLDGLVLARSGMHHSVNYRSVMLVGTPEPVISAVDKETALKAMFDAIYPGRWDHLRPVTAQELKATGILRLRITEGSAKVRTGGPIDDDEDYALPIWAGTVPIEMRHLEPIADPRNLETVQEPSHLKDIRLGRVAT